jgi:pSer/pThr/pTyr-binding forkhead associated (FHA) protein
VHAKIFLYNNMWVVEDMNSTNGTFVNDYPVTPGYPAVITTGDTIRFGDEEFMLCGR